MTRHLKMYLFVIIYRSFQCVCPSVTSAMVVYTLQCRFQKTESISEASQRGRPELVARGISQAQAQDVSKAAPSHVSRKCIPGVCQHLLLIDCVFNWSKICDAWVQFSIKMWALSFPDGTWNVEKICIVIFMKKLKSMIIVNGILIENNWRYSKSQLFGRHLKHTFFCKMMFLDDPEMSYHLSKMT